MELPSSTPHSRSGFWGGGNTTVYIAVGRALDVTADRTTGEQYFEYGNNLDHWRGGEEGKFKML